MVIVVGFLKLQKHLTFYVLLSEGKQQRSLQIDFPYSFVMESKIISTRKICLVTFWSICAYMLYEKYEKIRSADSKIWSRLRYWKGHLSRSPLKVRSPPANWMKGKISSLDLYVSLSSVDIYFQYRNLIQQYTKYTVSFISTFI